MLFNELFENKKVAEGFADEFAAFAKERGGVLRHGPQARKPETAPAAPAAQPVDRDALAAELKKLQAVFDPQYQYSDDHSFWSKQHDIAQRISYIKKQLSTGEQGVAEGYDKWGWHTSVINGEFMPTKYGNKAYVYLHDMDNESPRGGPQLVTFNKPSHAKKAAAQFGGKVVKTDLNTYRIVKLAGRDK